MDSQLFPEHFEQVTKSIFTQLDQCMLPVFIPVLCTTLRMAMSVTLIIKAHFSWTWQCTVLNCGNELVNLLLSCLQPYQLCVPEHMPINGCQLGLGCNFFGVLSLYHETKVPKPGVSHLLPERGLTPNSWLWFCSRNKGLIITLSFLIVSLCNTQLVPLLSSFTLCLTKKICVQNSLGGIGHAHQHGEWWVILLSPVQPSYHSFL